MNNRQTFENLDIVKKIKTEIKNLIKLNCYLTLSYYYSLLAELRYCFLNNCNFFDKQIIDNFNNFSSDLYKKELEQFFIDNNIKIAEIEK